MSVPCGCLNCMGDRWTTDEVLALAPDASSAKAGQKLATPTPWSGTGAADSLVWGHCKGSGKTPYQTIVELTSPAFKCSCPSRKFPCKHALGLLLLWAQGEVADAAQPADHAAAWLAARRERQSAAPAQPAASKDPGRAASTAAQRVRRVGSGIDELQLWLTDQLGHGLAGTDVDAYGRFDGVAARLVDAQAPGLASKIRALPELFAGPTSGVDWPARLLEEFGSLWSLSAAHQRLDLLPADLAATVRRHIGYPVAKADVLAAEGITDTWLCLGRRDTDDDRLQTRRTWIWGAKTKRFGVLLDYAPKGGVLPMRPRVGATLVAAMHFYPGSPLLRCLYDDAESPQPDAESPQPDALPHPDPLGMLVLSDIAAARRAHAQAIADDPWARRWPVVLDARLGRTVDGRPAAIDHAGDAIDILVTGERWPLLLALTGGARVPIFGSLGTDGLDVESVIVDGGVVRV